MLDSISFEDKFSAAVLREVYIKKQYIFQSGLSPFSYDVIKIKKDKKGDFMWIICILILPVAILFELVKYYLEKQSLLCCHFPHGFIFSHLTFIL